VKLATKFYTVIRNATKNKMSSGVGGLRRQPSVLHENNETKIIV